VFRSTQVVCCHKTHEDDESTRGEQTDPSEIRHKLTNTLSQSELLDRRRVHLLRCRRQNIPPTVPVLEPTKPCPAAIQFQNEWRRLHDGCKRAAADAWKTLPEAEKQERLALARQANVEYKAQRQVYRQEQEFLREYHHVVHRQPALLLARLYERLADDLLDLFPVQEQEQVQAILRQQQKWTSLEEEAAGISLSRSETPDLDQLLAKENDLLVGFPDSISIPMEPISDTKMPALEKMESPLVASEDLPPPLMACTLRDAGLQCDKSASSGDTKGAASTKTTATTATQIASNKRPRTEDSNQELRNSIYSMKKEIAQLHQMVRTVVGQQHHPMDQVSNDQPPEEPLRFCARTESYNSAVSGYTRDSGYTRNSSFYTRGSNEFDDFGEF